MWFGFADHNMRTAPSAGPVADLLRWLAPRFLVYLATAVFSALLFLLGAAVYSYISPVPFDERPLAPPAIEQAPLKQSNERTPSPSRPTITRPTCADRIGPPGGCAPAVSQIPSVGIQKDVTIGPSAEFVASRDRFEVRRNGDDLDLVITFNNPFNDPIWLVASKDEAELYVPGNRWAASGSSGIYLCDFKSECATSDALDRHASMLAPGGALKVTFSFARYINAPKVGSYVNVRLIIAARRHTGESRWDSWGDRLIYEPAILVQDAH